MAYSSVLPIQHPRHADRQKRGRGSSGKKKKERRELISSTFSPYYIGGRPFSPTDGGWRGGKEKKIKRGGEGTSFSFVNLLT